MKKQYVLIDNENVQPKGLAALAGEQSRVYVFVGADQPRINFDVAAALQPLGDRAQYIKIAGRGNNALDFHIAFYLGQIAASDPAADFHVVTKDTGFDPLIQHLKQEGIAVCRVSSIADLARMKTAKTTAQPERVATVIDHLRRSAARPKSMQALTNHIKTVLGKSLEAGDEHSIIEQLKTQGIVNANQTPISYCLSCLANFGQSSCLN